MKTVALICAITEFVRQLVEPKALYAAEQHTNVRPVTIAPKDTFVNNGANMDIAILYPQSPQRASSRQQQLQILYQVTTRGCMDVHRTVNVQMSIICAPIAHPIRRMQFVIASAIPPLVFKMRIVVLTIATMVFVHLAVLKVAYVTSMTTVQCVPMVIVVNLLTTAGIRDIAMLLHSDVEKFGV